MWVKPSPEPDVIYNQQQSQYEGVSPNVSTWIIHSMYTLACPFQAIRASVGRGASHMACLGEDQPTIRIVPRRHILTSVLSRRRMG